VEDLGETLTLIGCPESYTISRATTSFGCWIIPSGFGLKAVYDYDGTVVEIVPDHRGFVLEKGKAYWVKIHPLNQEDRLLTLPGYYGLQRLPDLPVSVVDICIASDGVDTIWFAGGQSPTGASTTVFSFDLNTREYTFHQSMPSSETVSRCRFNQGVFEVFARSESLLSGEQNLHHYTDADHSLKTITVELSLPIVGAGSGHTSHIISDHVYVVGGFDGLAPIDKIEVFGFSPTGRLNQSPFTRQMEIARFNHSSLAINNILYVVGGNDGTGTTTGIELFQISPIGQLSVLPTTATLVDGRESFSLLVKGGVLHLLGGGSASGLSVLIESFKIQENGDLLALNQGLTLETPRKFHTSHIVGDWLYVLGGQVASGVAESGTQASSNIEKFRISPNGLLTRIATNTALRHPRYHHTSHVLGNYIYILGGTNAQGALKNIEVLRIEPDGRLTSLTQTVQLTAGRIHHTSHISGSTIVVLGGFQESGQEIPTNLVEIFEIQNGLLQNSRSLKRSSVARYQHSSLLGEDYIYIFGGKHGLFSFSDSLSIFRLFQIIEPLPPVFQWRVNESIQVFLDQRATLMVDGNSILAAGGKDERGDFTRRLDLISPARLSTVKPGTLFSENQVFIGGRTVRLSLPDRGSIYTCKIIEGSGASCRIEDNDTLVVDTNGFGAHRLELEQRLGGQLLLRSFMDVVVDEPPLIFPFEFPAQVAVGSSVPISPVVSYPDQLSCLFSYFSTAAARFTSLTPTSAILEPLSEGDFLIEVSCYSLFGLVAATSASLYAVNSGPVANFDLVGGFFVNPGALALRNLSLDPDGQSLTYLWSLIQAPDKAVLSTSKMESRTPVISLTSPGDYSLKLSVTDPFGERSDLTNILRVNSPPTTSLILDPFVRFAELPTGRSDLSAKFANDRVYIVGGESASGRSTTMLELAPETGSVLAIRSTSFEVLNADLSFIDPVLYVSTGQAGLTTLNEVIQWNATEEAFSITTVPANPTHFTYASNAQFYLIPENHLLIDSSYVSAFTDESIWSFPNAKNPDLILLNLVNHTLIQALPYHANQYGMKIFSKNFDLYLSGGRSQEGDLIPYIQHVNPQAKLWDRKTLLPKAQAQGAAPVLVNDSLWLIGGRSEEGVYSNLIQKDNHAQIDDDRKSFFLPGKLLQITNAVSDPDPLDILVPSVTFSSIPVGASTPTLITSSMGNWLFQGDTEGIYIMDVVYRDSLSLSSSLTLALTLNYVPIIYPGSRPPWIISTGAILSLTASVQADDWTSYRYEVISGPYQSQPTLTLTGNLGADFVADLRGSYLVELTVWDQWGAVARQISEIRANVTVNYKNDYLVIPEKSTVLTGVTTTFAIVGSNIPLDDFFYEWRLESKPLGSTLSLPTVNGSSLAFIPDLTGEYLVLVEGYRKLDPIGLQGTRRRKIRVRALQGPLIQLDQVTLDESRFKPEMEFQVSYQEFNSHPLVMDLEYSLDGIIWLPMIPDTGSPILTFPTATQSQGVITATVIMTEFLEFNQNYNFSYRLNIRDAVLNLSTVPLSGSTSIFLADSLPVVTFTTGYPEEVNQDRLVLRYSIEDAEEMPVGVTVQYVISGETPSRATLNTLNSNDLKASSATGVLHQNVWDAHGDLGSSLYLSLQVQIVPVDSRSGQIGVTATTTLAVIDYESIEIIPREELLREEVSTISIDSSNQLITTLILNVDFSTLVDEIVIEVSPGTFTSDTGIRVSHLIENPVAQSFGFSIASTQGMTNSIPLSVAIHFGADLLRSTHTDSEDRLLIYGRNRHTLQWEEIESKLDSDLNELSFEIFGIEIMTDFLITSVIFRPQGFQLEKAENFDPANLSLSDTKFLKRLTVDPIALGGKRIALFIPDSFSSLADHRGPYALLSTLVNDKVYQSGDGSSSLSSVYDYVYSLTYPAASNGIAFNGDFLATEFISKLPVSSALDIYGFGMGGLVARWALEVSLQRADRSDYLGFINSIATSNYGGGLKVELESILAPGASGPSVVPSPLLTDSLNLGAVKNLIMIESPSQGISLLNFERVLDRESFLIPLETVTVSGNGVKLAPGILAGFNDLGVKSSPLVELRYHRFDPSFTVRYLSLGTLVHGPLSQTSGDGLFAFESFMLLPGFHPRDYQHFLVADILDTPLEAMREALGHQGFALNFSDTSLRDRPKLVKKKMATTLVTQEEFQNLDDRERYEDVYNYRVNPSDLVESFLGLDRPRLDSLLPTTLDEQDPLLFQVSVRDQHLQEFSASLHLGNGSVQTIFRYDRDYYLGSSGIFSQVSLKPCCFDQDYQVFNWESVWNLSNIRPESFRLDPESSNLFGTLLQSISGSSVELQIQESISSSLFSPDQAAVPIFVTATDWFGNRSSFSKTLIRNLLLDRIAILDVAPTQNSVNILWTHVNHALGYDLTLLESGNPVEQITINSQDKTSAFIPALRSGTQYSVSIRPFNDSFTGTSDSTTFITRTAPPPPFPITISQPSANESFSTRSVMVLGSIGNYSGLAKIKVNDLDQKAFQVVNGEFQGELEMFLVGTNLINVIAGTLRETVPVFYAGNAAGLETLHVSQKTLTLSLYDVERDDGDQIDLIVNGVYVLVDHALGQAPGKTLSITLRKGSNTLVFHADNEGLIASNSGTFELSEVSSGKSLQSWSIRSGEDATVVINAP
jgi:hypothetical protein